MLCLYSHRFLSVVKKRWWIVLIVIFIFEVLFGWIANTKIEEKEYDYETYLAQNEKFEESMQVYDISTAELEASIANTKTIVDEIQNYMDNSVYMNIDSQKVFVSSAKYEIITEDINTIAQWILNYLKNGEIWSQFNNLYPEMRTEYMAEIFSYSVQETILELSVIHYDGDLAQKYLEAIEKCILVTNENNYDLNKVEKVDYTKIDTEILNNQNNQLNNIRIYQNALSDLNGKMADHIKSKNEFIETYKPYFAESSDKKIICYHLIVGSLIGVSFSIVIFIIMLLIDDYVWNPKDLHNMGINVLLQTSVVDLKKLKIPCELLECLHLKRKVLFSMIKSDTTNEDVIFEFQKNLDIGIENTTVINVLDNVDDLKSMIEIGNCILVVYIGLTTCAQIREHIVLCEKYSIPILGSVVIE